MNLTQDQLKFLSKHGVSVDRVFFAEGMVKSEYHDIMKQNGYLVAVGVTPCNAYGHSMRTRTGHCVQCRPANLAYLQRFDQPAYIYVAHSARHHFVKVGFACDPVGRMNILNRHGYAGARDWLLLATQHCEQAGRVEANIQGALAVFQVPANTRGQGIWGDCREVFNCTPDDALAVFWAHIGTTNLSCSSGAMEATYPDPLTELIAEVFQTEAPSQALVSAAREELRSVLLDFEISLSEEELQCFRMRFPLDGTYPARIDEIALTLGRSQSLVAKAVDMAIRKHRHPCRRQKLEKVLLRTT